MLVFGALHWQLWLGGLLEDRVIFLTYCLRINYRLLHPLHSQVQPEAAQILAKDRMADWTVSYLVRDGGEITQAFFIVLFGGQWVEFLVDSLSHLSMSCNPSAVPVELHGTW